MLELSRRLATIGMPPVPLTLNPRAIAGRPDLQRIRALYTRLELRFCLVPWKHPGSARGAAAPGLPEATVVPCGGGEYAIVRRRKL